MTTQNPKDQPPEKNLANKVIEIIINDCELVHDQQKAPFAIVNKGGARQVFSIGSKNFSDWVASRYYESKKSTLSDASLKTVLSTLSGKAVYDGKPVSIYTRIAKTEDGYWLDLCNERWEAVLINKEGWRVEAGGNTPLFCRSNSMMAIPNPIKGCSLDPLWDLVNIPPEYRLIVIAWLLECLREDTPHVVMEFVGEQGSAKSTTQKLLKMLIDPNIANLRAAPKKVEDVWIGAINSHLVSFENISFLGQDYQDALCVMATGGAHATRTLYTNREEVIIELKKPIILNGITVNVTAQDLIDRALHIELPPITKRLQSSNVEVVFSQQYANIVGALLDQFVTALSLINSVVIDDEDKPRMVDFAYLGEAVFQANHHESGDFIKRYQKMRKKAVHRTIESSPIGWALFTYLQSNPNGWNGKLIDLLAQLGALRPAGETNWPRSAKGLGDALRRLTPALRTLGFKCIANQKTSGSILWDITPLPSKVPNQCPRSTGSPEISSGSDPDHGNLGHSVHLGHESKTSEGGGDAEPIPV
jgi:hypothetical protein